MRRGRESGRHNGPIMNRKQRIANTSTHAKLMFFLFIWTGLTLHEQRIVRMADRAARRKLR